MSNWKSSNDDEPPSGQLSASNRHSEQSSNSRHQNYQPTDWFSSEAIQRSVLTLQVPKKWLRRFGIAAIAVVGGGTIGFLINRFSGHPAAGVSTEQPIQVSTQIVTVRSIGGTQTLSGNVKPGEAIAITSRVGGQIISLPIKEGERVKTRQLLANINVKDLDARSNQATAAITQAQSGVTVAQAATTQAIASSSQVTAQLRQAQAALQQAQAQVRQTQAQLRNAISQKQSVQAKLADAQLTQQRQKILQEQGAIAKSSLDAANNQVAMLKSLFKQATANVDRSSQAITQAKAGVNQAVASINRVKADQAQAKNQVQQARAEVNQAHDRVKQVEAESQATANLTSGSVTAPFDGIVTHRHTEVGAMVGVGQQIITLENTSKQRFSVDVPESAIAQIKQGDLVNIHLDAIKQVISGRIERIVPTNNSNPRSFTIEIALPKNSALMSGMFGRVEFPGTAHQEITIPNTALLRRGQMAEVYTVDHNNKAILHSVKTGKTLNGSIEILSGLSPSDRVIINNLSQLSDGRSVVIK